jgi:DNA-binding transcriptional LysR family regulator
MNRLDAITAFVRVAELSSFTQAASSLGLPKSSVSAAVLQLEAHLKVQLLYRTTRRVQLTHDGQAYLDRARDMLADLEDMDGMFMHASAELTGVIRVDMTVAMARNQIFPRLPEFLDRHPGLEIEFSCTDRRVDVVAEGFDCVIRAGIMGDSGLMARQLGAMPMLNVASPTYIARFGMPQTLDDLDHHRLVHYVMQLGSKPFGFEYWDGQAYRSRPVAGVISVNNTVAYNSAALAGLGIIQAPESGVKDSLNDGSLVTVLPQYRAEPLPLAIVYPRRRHQARRVRAFMDWVAEVMKPYLD